jgi:hypothetical protein
MLKVFDVVVIACSSGVLVLSQHVPLFVQVLCSEFYRKFLLRCNKESRACTQDMILLMRSKHGKTLKLGRGRQHHKESVQGYTSKKHLTSTRKGM